MGDALAIAFGFAVWIVFFALTFGAWLIGLGTIVNWVIQ